MRDYYMPETPVTDAMAVTNADRIRAMSDEALAELILRIQIENIAVALKVSGIRWEPNPDSYKRTAKACLKWLKQPVKED